MACRMLSPVEVATSAAPVALPPPLPPPPNAATLAYMHDQKTRDYVASLDVTSKPVPLRKSHSMVLPPARPNGVSPRQRFSETIKVRTVAVVILFCCHGNSAVDCSMYVKLLES